MLVKWAIEGRRKTAKLQPSANDHDQHAGTLQQDPPSNTNVRGKDRPHNAGSPGAPREPETTAHALTAQLDRLHFESDAAFAKSSESNGDRAMRRIHAEERDTMLRDDKLLALTGPPMSRHNSHQPRESVSSTPLTEANVEKFTHAHDDGPIDAHTRHASPDVDSAAAVQHRSSIDNRDLLAVRPSIAEARPRQKSELTITGPISPDTPS